MLIWGLLLGVVALLCWPDARALRRVKACLPRPRRRVRHLNLTVRRVPVLLVPLAVVAALGTVGLPGAVGVAALAAAAIKQYNEHAHTRARCAAGRELAEALRTLVAELRAGAHPAAAAESAASEVGQDTACVLRTVAATVRLGGEPETIHPPRGAALSGIDPVGQIGRCWALAQRHGLPFADVLEALRKDVEGRARLAANAHADMAGPRASAIVLAVLPAAGLALGEAMGAGPLHILATTSAGRLLLGAGCVLLACGLLFSARLTRGGVPS